MGGRQAGGEVDRKIHVDGAHLPTGTTLLATCAAFAAACEDILSFVCGTSVQLTRYRRKRFAYELRGCFGRQSSIADCLSSRDLTGL